MSGSKDANAVYKYNVKPVIHTEEVEGTYFWETTKLAEAVQDDYGWKGNEIMICTTCRSGTHMGWYLVRYLLQGSTKPLPDVMTESYYPPYFRLEGSPQSGPRRVLSCHLLPCQFSCESLLKTGNRKFLFIVRNPNDSAVSMFNVWKDMKGIKGLPKEFPEYYNQFITGTAKTYPYIGWFTHIKAWEEYAAKNPDVAIMFQMFEDLVRKPRECILEIARFLDIEVPDDAFLNDLVEINKFDNMKKNKLGSAIKEQFSDDATKALYRKGQIGEWKKWLTVQNYELFNKVFPEQSKDLACKDRLVFT